MAENITDKNQRDEALDPRRSFIVQAPAGSGKTSLLIQRFLVLLAHVQKRPEEVLAITFTRKAAAEMRSRIFATLTAKNDSKGLASKVLERDQKMGWNLMDNPNRLAIYTIDGFCNSLTRQMPIMSRFGAQPEIIEGVDATICYQQAIANLLQTVQANAPLQEVLLHLDNNYQKFENLLISMLAKRDQWLPHFNQNNVLTNLQNIINDNLSNCRNSFPAALKPELFELAAFAMPENEAASWCKIAVLLLTKDYNWRKTFDKRHGFPANNKLMKQRMQDLMTQLQDYGNLRFNLEALSLSPHGYTKEQQQLINNIIITLKQAAAELKLVFRDKAAVDYIEIALAAERALGTEDNPTDLALKLDYKIQHILVDEFQDTSTSQYRLLKQLTAGWQGDDGRTLFLVGDPMQSIYRFREAKVGLFLRAKNDGINALKLHSLTLSTNFRSEKYIIDWVNKTFPDVFPLIENIGTGAIPFIPSTAIHNTLQKQVGMHASTTRNYFNEAQQVIDIIKQNKIQNPHDSIAILVRSRSHLADILPALQTAKLNYKAVELETLNENPLIQDLFSLTRALVNPLDRIAWLAILRAPWCGLKLADLYTLANTNHNAPLWDHIINYKQFKLDTDAKQRLEYLINALQPVIGTLPLQRQQIEDVWIALNGHACTRELYHAKTFFDLLTDIKIDTDQIPILAAKLTTLYAKPDSNADDSIQVMTIHKAKGLEFDTVILPGLNRSPKRNEDPLLMWAERPSSTNTDDLILAPIKAADCDHDDIYRYLQFEDKRKNQYEIGRLLYVAITRAKKNLHLLACVDDKPNSGSLLASLWPHFNAAKTKDEAPVKIETLSIGPNLIRIKKLDKLIQRPIAPTLPQSPKYEANTTSQHIGTVIHKILEEIATIGITNYELLPLKWRNMLMQLGTFTDLDEHIYTITIAINNTLQDPRGQWILDKTHAQAQSELAISLLGDKKIQHHIIDRTFVADNIRWIIDYKTTSSNNFIDKHKIQLETYARAMHHVYNRPIRMGIYFPMFSDWHEWKFNR